MKLPRTDNRIASQEEDQDMKYRAISTDRLIIESAPIDERSLREMVGWLNDPFTMQYSEQRHVHHTIYTQLDYISLYQDENLLLGIYTGKALIGTISVMVDAPN